MRRNLGFTGFLLAFAFICAAFAVTYAAFAAGRGGFEGGGQARSAAPGGSGGFRPSGGEEPRNSFAEPRAQVFQRPVIEPQHAAPPAPGRASILPSLNTGNRTFTPRVVQPVQAPALPHPAPVPGQRVVPQNDFLGFRPDRAENRQPIPNHPAVTINPAVTNRARVAGSPAARAVLPNPPGRPERPARPALPERWRSVNNNFGAQFNHWQQANAAGIAAFQGSRAQRWNQIRERGIDPNWPRQFRSPAYQDWRRNVWNFRRDRAGEVWAATRDMHENLFDDHWWSTCWWRRNPWVIGANVSPWWWWNAASWADTAAFFGSTIGPQPIPYDPGTDVFYDGSSYIVDGQDDGSATDASDQAAALAGPPVDDDDVPVPEPPADGQPQEWLSLGAWALTQEEQGNPVMFFQLSVNRDGIVAGGYKNALTGDEQPIVGRLDRRTQRVAWHINSTPQTVFETGLSDLNYDVASVFVHFGNTQTQTWLLVRLPSPASPPANVNVNVPQ
jgi:hypothetical protein